MRMSQNQTEVGRIDVNATMHFMSGCVANELHQFESGNPLVKFAFSPVKSIAKYSVLMRNATVRYCKQSVTAMPGIYGQKLPSLALVVTYFNARAYTDCFSTAISRTVTHAEFVEAFYSGRLFKLER